MAESGDFDILAVRELDRLSRNLAKQLIVEEELRRHGIDVQYVLADYPDTAEGRLNKHIRATIAEYEREKGIERMVRGTRNKIKAGSVMVYRRPPYGYQVVEEDGKWRLVVYEPEARIVRLAYEWYASGDENGNTMTLSDITRRLTKMAIPTRGDKQNLNKKRGVGEWSRMTVHRILRNETYAGVWHYGKKHKAKDGQQPRFGEEMIAVGVPPIVPRETWEVVQARFSVNRNRADLRRKHDYLLGGRVTCGCCGLKMRGCANGQAGAPRVHAYYVCSARTHKLELVRECNLPTFRADQVDTAVWRWVKSFLTNPEALAQGLWQVHQEREQENLPIRERLAVVDDLLADNRTQLERLLDLYLSGDFPKDVLTDRKVRLEATIFALEKERAGLVAYLNAQLLTAEQIQTIQEFAAKVSETLGAMDGDLGAMRGLVEALDVQITLAVEDGQKVVYARCMIGEDSWLVSQTRSGLPCQLV